MMNLGKRCLHNEKAYVHSVLATGYFVGWGGPLGHQKPLRLKACLRWMVSNWDAMKWQIYLMRPPDVHYNMPTPALFTSGYT